METATRQIPDKLKARLYPEVLRQFSEKDFHEVSIRDISAATGISTGTLYKYFDSKEDLIFTIIDDKLVELAGLMRTHIAGLEDTREMFRKVFWVTMDFFDRNPDLAVAAFITVPLKSFMKSGAYRREKEIDILNAIVRQAREKGGVSTDVEDRYFADLYFMIAQRHIHNWYLRGRREKLSRSIGDFFDMFWKIVEPLAK